ncbi:hypothetical protein ACFLV7_01595 [Chloroflexota bacterium]
MTQDNSDPILPEVPLIKWKEPTAEANLIKTKTTQFAGYECIQIGNDIVSLWVAKSFGPRVVGFAPEGGHNLFAELPDARLECPGAGFYSLRGGHRLWCAPEYPPLTYLPDDEAVHIEETDNGLTITQPVEAQTGLQKSISITLPDQTDQVVLDHTIRNCANDALELAPWAITMLKPGGVAILPQPIGLVDEYGVLPNRSIMFWPYTQVNSPHIMWGDRYIFIRADLKENKLKIGFPNPGGWLGYFLDGTLFVKYARYDQKKLYYDDQSSSECYCDAGVLELETLGPRITLGPGESVTHRELWKIFPSVLFEASEDSVKQLVEEWGISIP